MEERERQYQAYRSNPASLVPQASLKQVPIIQSDTPLAPPQITGLRPLSDIRELSEPSLIDAIFQSNIKKVGKQFVARSRSSRSNSSPCRVGPPANAQSNFRPAYTSTEGTKDGSSSYSSTPEAPNFYNIPISSVPRRSSSQKHSRYSPRAQVQQNTGHATISPHHRLQQPGQRAVLYHGHSQSPLKDAGLRSNSMRSNTSPRAPAHTYHRHPPPIEILEFPSFRHPRVKLDLEVNAPLFVGGGSIEGQVKVTVDENIHVRQRRSLGICGLSMDLMGFEETSERRRATFLSLGNELIDADRPPPPTMAESAHSLKLEELFWTLIPSISVLPFMISLPLDTGPPTFSSKHARIRFLLCVTAILRDGGKLYEVRKSQDVYVLPTYDPEKALTSLDRPLTATEMLSMAHNNRRETLRLLAGLHRQVWVSGSSIFVDVNIANQSHKSVKRIALELERNLLLYKHTPATTQQTSVDQTRVFETNERLTVARTTTRAGTRGWAGIEPQKSETRTWELQLPRGHASVQCGKYFEVRFFLNVKVSLSSSRTVSVQLPVILIHITSLDIVPNSVAQVAAAIEEKKKQYLPRTSERRQHRRAGSRSNDSASSRLVAENLDIGKKSTYSQGRAFAAPLRQLVDRQRAQKAEIAELRHALDSSPRKMRLKTSSAGGNLASGRYAANSAFARPLRPASLKMGINIPPPPPFKLAGSNVESPILKSRSHGMRPPLSSSSSPRTPPVPAIHPARYAIDGSPGRSLKPNQNIPLAATMVGVNQGHGADHGSQYNFTTTQPLRTAVGKPSVGLWTRNRIKKEDPLPQDRTEGDSGKFIRPTRSLNLRSKPREPGTLLDGRVIRRLGTTGSLKGRRHEWLRGKRSGVESPRKDNTEGIQRNRTLVQIEKENQGWI